MPSAIRQQVGNDEANDADGGHPLAEALITRLETGELSYLDAEGQLRATETLPYVTVVVEAAGGAGITENLSWSAGFGDALCHGYEVGLGLTVVGARRSTLRQDIQEILHSEVTVSPCMWGNSDAGVWHAPADHGLRFSMQGNALLSTSYHDLDLLLQISH